MRKWIRTKCEGRGRNEKDTSDEERGKDKEKTSERCKKENANEEEIERRGERDK